MGRVKIDSDHAQEIHSQTLLFLTREAAQIVLEILKEEQTLAQLSSTYGVHVTQLRKWKTQVLAGLPRLFDDEQKTLRELEAEQARERQELYAEIGRLTTQLGWLKKKSGCDLSRSERLTMVERAEAVLPLTTQAALLGLNRTSLYYQAVPPSADELYVRRRIDEIYTAHPFTDRARLRSNCGGS